MVIDERKSVGEIAVEYPFAKSVFDKLSIDYCCGGQRSVGAACEENGIAFADVVSLLSEAEGSVDGAKTDVSAADLSKMSLSALCDHIVCQHHDFTRAEDERITALAEKASAVHGESHPELLKIRTIFAELRSELEAHMLKEERMLFPYISLMESSLNFGLAKPVAPFGSTRNPVSVMLREHDATAAQIDEIDQLSDGFSAPEDACPTYRGLYEALEGLKRDLHEHIHLENNILFPRAISLEEGAVKPGDEIKENPCETGSMCCHSS